MKLQPYPDYKKTGSVWIGELPSHWSTALLRHVCDKITDGSHFSPAPARDGKPYVTVRDLDAGHINLHTCAKISDADFESLVRSGCRPIKGDVLFSKDGTVGKVAVVEDGDFVVLSSLAILGTNRDKHRPEYLAYFLQSASGEKQVESMYAGAALRRITLDSICTVRLPVLPLEEQDCIVSFLDRETTKIDTLIAKQEKLIELLKEKRQAVISHAVTKGLDPTVPMKLSGVEWLGDVPEHWAVAAVGYRYEVALGKMLDQKRITGEHLAPYLRNTDVQWGKINTSSLPLMDFDEADRIRYSLKAGDLLVCEGGEVGRAAIWEMEKSECYYQKALHRMRPYDKAADVPKFMFYLLCAAASQDVFAVSGGKSTIAHLPAEALRAYRFAFPSVDEQQGIVAHLDRVVEQIDQLVDKSNQAIALQREHRSALISAAVTGKIDVRDAAPNLQQAA